MASIRKRTRERNGGTVEYYVVDFSVSQGGKVRRKQKHFRVDPDDPGRARALAEEFKAEVDRKLARLKLGGEVDTGPRDVELADALDQFAVAVRPNCSESYHDIIAYTLNKFRDRLADRGVKTTGQLRRAHLSGFVEDMQAKGNKAKSISNDLRIIKRALTWAADEGYLSHRLLRSFPSVRVPKTRRRVLTEDEIETLLEAVAGTELYPPVMVSLYSGARRGEVVALRGTDVDLAAGVLHFRAAITKAARAGDVPLHSRLRPVVAERAGKDDWLVVRDSGAQWPADALTRAFTDVARGLGWSDVTFHCLRHTFATRLAASGKVSPYDLQRLMRHRSISTTMIYVNLAKQRLPDIDVF